MFDIEAKLNFGGDLIYVLTACTAASGSLELEFMIEGSVVQS